MLRAKGKYKNAKRELKKPLGYVHPSGTRVVAACVKRNGIWEASYESSHRLIFSWWHKVLLTSDDVIHHVDGDKANDHWTNLSRMTRKDFAKMTFRGTRKRKRNLRGSYVVRGVK